MPFPTSRTWLAVVALVGCRPPNSGAPADLLITNAKVFAADSTDRFAEAVAVRGNQIVAVGTTAALAAYRGQATTVIDAAGAAVTPGFNDAHVHFVGGSLGLTQVNLLDIDALSAVKQRITVFALANPTRPWVLGRGWYYGTFPGGLPTKEILDSLVPDRPAAIDCYDGHTQWVNSRALALAGITRNTPNPPNGVIVKDARTGEPTGVLKEGAQGLLDKVLPPVSREEKLAALKQGIALAHQLGVTSVQEAGIGAADVELFDALRRAGDLKLRVAVALGVRPGFSEQDLVRLDSIRKAVPDDDRLKLGAVKMFADGVIESHTAAMLAPYANRATTGLPEYQAAEMRRIVTLLDGRGWQIMIHAIGDAGIRMALDAFDTAQRVNPAPARGRRHRLEHIEAMSAADIPRFGRLGVIASMQPFHANPNQNVLDVWAVNLGPERAGRAWAWKSIRDAGGRLAFGTDWPVVELDPRPGIHTALTRQTPNGDPREGFVPGERLDLSTVLRTYTAGSAYASFDETTKGTLAPGQLADLVIWATDIFAAPAAQVKDAGIKTTIFDGKVVYSRPAP